MKDFIKIRAFLEVARHESFATAGRQLGMTSSAVTKHIQGLEKDLQVKLFNRTTRTVSLTESGDMFKKHARRAMNEMDEAQSVLHDLQSSPKGALKVSVPMSLGYAHLSHVISNFVTTYPDITMDVSFDDRKVDIIAEEFDLVVRIGALSDSSLVAKRLASCPLIICASPKYLQKHGTPQTPEDLLDHNVLHYSREKHNREWQYKDRLNKMGSVKLTGDFRSDTGFLMRDVAIDGGGVTILPIFFVSDALASGQLIPLLQEYVTWPPRDIYAVFPSNQYVSRRLRLFIDHLSKACKALPWETTL